MTPSEWFEHGYHDLVSVIPPDGALAPSSKIPPEARGKVPGIFDGKHWTGYPWRSHQPSPAELRRWETWGGNLGLLATQFPLIDIDVDDPELAKRLDVLFQFELGWAPVRIGRPPHRGLVYGCQAGIRKQKLSFKMNGQVGHIEILGEGQQFVIEGKHPCGTNYEWPEGPPGPTPELTWVTPAEILEVLKTAADWIVSKGGVLLKGGGQLELADAPPPNQESLRGDEDMVASAVAAIPNTSDDRDDYLLMGYAIKAAGGSFSLWWSWCERWEGGENDLERARADWAGMHPPFRVGADWLYEQARAAGWDWAAHEFEATEEPPAEPVSDDDRPAAWSHADLANRLVIEYQDRLRWIPEMGQFAVWHGSGWELDVADFTGRWIHKLCVGAATEVLRDGSLKAGTAMRLATKLSDAPILEHVRRLVKVSPRIIGRLEDFDTDPWILPTPAGLVRLDTGVVLPHSPAHLTLGRTRVSPEEGEPGHWLRFLEETTGGDQQLISYLQRSVGYWLSGAVMEHVLWFFYGAGGNGKSTFLNAIAWALGDLARTAPMSTFTASKYDSHPTELAMLRGARLVTAQETQEGRAWDEARIKQLTGGDPVSARFMRMDFFTYLPVFSLVLSGNHQPRIRNLDEAMRRRFHMVPFTRTPARLDPLLPDKLRGEAGQILAWAMQGHRLWRSEGLSPPEVVLAATEEYFASQDPVGSWIEVECHEGADYRTPTSDLWDSFRRWAHGAGEETHSEKWLADQLAKRGLARYREGGGGRRGFRGIGLRSAWDKQGGDDED